MIFALDTNIVSYFIQEDKSIISRFGAEIRKGNSIVIPPIVYYEIRRGFKHKVSPKKEVAFMLLCSKFPIGKMTLPIWEKAAEIYGLRRKLGKPVGDSDILIAAFAVVNSYTLVTANIKDFKDISTMKLVDWMQPQP